MERGIFSTNVNENDSWFERWVFVATYGPGSERSEEARNDLCEELSECLDDFRADESVFLLGNLNVRVGELEIEGVTGKFGVPV